MKMSDRFILRDGSVEFRYNDRLHRVDGPAMNLPDGTKKWFIEGRLHRIDGPADVPRWRRRMVLLR
jgi:hypothetical protein